MRRCVLSTFHSDSDADHSAVRESTAIIGTLQMSRNALLKRATEMTKQKTMATYRVDDADVAKHGIVATKVMKHVPDEIMAIVRVELGIEWISLGP